MPSLPPTHVKKIRKLEEKKGKPSPSSLCLTFAYAASPCVFAFSMISADLAFDSVYAAEE